jgi:N-acyl-phosphatidylethanolamine-hydrolysing phospholipase D
LIGPPYSNGNKEDIRCFVYFWGTFGFLLYASIGFLISHNHYDHLDAESIRSLPEDARFFVSLGLKEYIETLHKGPVRELDWWESMEVGEDTRLVCLPAQHWSRRIGQASNSTLWASYLLITAETSVFYGADSGYLIGYKEFGRRFPGIAYALLSTTAYHPCWFMHIVHKNIPEALDAFRDLGAKTLYPFPVGDLPSGR